MHESFRQYVEPMHASFVRLTAMHPTMIRILPRDAPSECIYLFSECDPTCTWVGRGTYVSD
jgi:hypothetical protein